MLLGELKRSFVTSLLSLRHSQRIKQENDVLRTYLKAAQDDVATLLDEKRTLMDWILDPLRSARL